MSGRYLYETDDEYFRRMVELHKPVKDIMETKPCSDSTSLSNWQTNFDHLLTTTKQVQEVQSTKSKTKLRDRKQLDTSVSEPERDPLWDLVFSKKKPKWSCYLHLYACPELSYPDFVFFFPLEEKVMIRGEMIKLYESLVKLDLSNPETIE